MSWLEGLFSGFGTDRFGCGGPPFVDVAGPGGGLGAGAGQDVEGQVAAAFGPFVVLLGEHGAGQAGDGVSVGEDADDAGAAADLAVEPLDRYLELLCQPGL
jgi:hypothetical protein